MASLFNINKDFLKFAQELEDNGGELTPELQNFLEENEKDFDNTGQFIVTLVKQLQ